MLEIIQDNLPLVISGAVALLISLIGGTAWAKFKTKLKQLSELINELVKALEDDKISKEEMKEIVKDFKALIGKK